MVFIRKKHLEEITRRTEENTKLSKDVLENTNSLRKNIDSLGEKIKDLRDIDVRKVILYIHAIIEYLNLDFEDEWVDDMNYITPEPRKIRKLKAFKKHDRRTSEQGK